MKKIVFLFLTVLMTSGAFAQDILHFKDGRTYEAQVIEIAETKVRFHKMSDLKGKVYGVNKNKLTKVVYESGKTVSFVKTTTPAKTETESDTIMRAIPTEGEDTKISAADAIPDDIPLERPDTTHHEVAHHKFVRNSVSIGPRFALPMADLGDDIETGFGAVASFDLGMNEHFAFTGSFGFTQHKIKENPLNSGTKTLTPMQAGINYEGIFIELVSGLVKSRNTYNAYTDTTTSTVTSNKLETLGNFSYAPAIGYKTHGVNLRVAYAFIPQKSKDYSYVSVGLLLDILNSRKPGEKKTTAPAH